MFILQQPNPSLQSSSPKVCKAQAHKITLFSNSRHPPQNRVHLLRILNSHGYSNKVHTLLFSAATSRSPTVATSPKDSSFSILTGLTVTPSVLDFLPNGQHKTLKTYNL